MEESGPVGVICTVMDAPYHMLKNGPYCELPAMAGVAQLPDLTLEDTHAFLSLDATRYRKKLPNRFLNYLLHTWTFRLPRIVLYCTHRCVYVA